EGLQALAIREQPGKPDERILRQRHQLDAHQHERGVATLFDVLAEILNQLFASLARVDPAAVEQHRAVEPVSSAKDGTAREEMRWEFPRWSVFLGSGLCRVGVLRLG